MTIELPTEWLAAMPDVVARLEGIRHPRIAHVGRGRDADTLAIARAFLDAHVDGLDSAPGALADARARAADASLDGRVRFLHGDAGGLAAHGSYDLVVLREPVLELAALAAVRTALTAGGTVLVVADKAGDAVRDRAAAAGYGRADVLPVHHDDFRLYRLDP